MNTESPFPEDEDSCHFSCRGICLLFREKLKRRLRGLIEFFRLFPAVFMLFACILTALTFCLRLPLPLLYFILLLLTLLSVSSVGIQKTLFLILIPAAVVFVSAEFSSRRNKLNIIATIAGHDEFQCTAALRVCDPFVSKIKDPEFVSTELKCQLLWFSYAEDDEKIVVKGKNHILMNVPGQNIHASYGDVIIAKGHIYPPATNVFTTGFNYGKYLSYQGIHEIFKPDAILKIESHSHFLGKVFVLRDLLLKVIFARITQKETKAIVTGMLFGRKTFIPKETKNDFIRSGIIHILTVSGTHVMIIAGVSFLLFAFFPFVLRNIITILFVFMYVVLTGMHESSIRAFVMLSIFLIMRCFFTKVSSFNSLAIAGAVLLCLEPFSIMKTGMHYSFLSVLILLLFGRKMKKIKKFSVSQLDKGLSISSKIRQKHVNFFHYWSQKQFHALFVIFISSLVVGFGTSPLTLLYQGILPVYGFLANFLVIPLASLVFIFSALIVIFSFITPLSAFFSLVLEKTIFLILFIGNQTAKLFDHPFPVPPTWTVFVFIIFFILILISDCFYGNLFSCCILFAVFSLWYFMPCFIPREIAIFHGGTTSSETLPSVIITNPKYGTADVFHLPNTSYSYAVSDYLLSRGIDTCRNFVICSEKVRDYNGLTSFVDKINVQNLYVPEKIKKRFASFDYPLKKHDSSAPDSNTFFFGFLTKKNVPAFEFHTSEMYGIVSTKHVSILSQKKENEILLDSDFPLSSRILFEIEKIKQ